MTEIGDSNEAQASEKEWNAEAYHRLSEPQFAWGIRVLERLSLHRGERVLDAGCGSGRLTRELADRMRSGVVVGCDLSENMSRAAAVTLGSDAARAVVCANLLNLPFGAVFDAVISTATFHWILDHARLFAELRRVIRPGGRLEAQCGGGRNLAVIHARADALTSTPRIRALFDGWSDPWLFAWPRETERRLVRAGFREARCWLEKVPTVFPDATRFRAFLEAVVMRPYLARLPDPELRRRFLDRLVEQSATDETPFALDYWRLNISAIA